MHKDVYQIITERIIALLESGTIPWRQPWKGGGPPQNLISGKPYRGINVFLLNAARFASRLGRAGITEPVRFGSDPYSREELVAEMGAAFLCGHCRIENRTIAESASFIQGWLDRLRNDRKFVVQAAAQAQKACDFIRNDEQPAEGDIR